MLANKRTNTGYDTIKVMRRTHIIGLLIVILFLIGLGLRFAGTRDNHSFWSDEAYVASVARDILTNKITLSTGLTRPGAMYQPLHVLTILLSFSILGYTEFAARLPSIIFSSLGIICAYLLGKKMSNTTGGVLASFLWTIAQLNMAMATQAKPYSYIQAAFVCILYLIARLEEDENRLNLHILIIFLIITSSLMHLLGIIVGIPYLMYILWKHLPGLHAHDKWLLYVWPIAFVGFIIVLEVTRAIIFKLPKQEIFAHFNYFTFYRELFWRNYAFIVLPALFGLLASYKRFPVLIASLFLWIAILSYFWIFRGYSHNVRYLVPLFGILFVYFGVFWGHVAEKVLNKHYMLTTVIIIAIIFIGGYKVVRKPASYYSPNADLFGDVQIADYKTFYNQINSKFPKSRKIAIFNDWYDTQYWYLQRPVTAYFMKGKAISEKHNIDGKPIYGTLAQFIQEQKKYSQGIIIVEDWESILPEDIKQYVKKNFKREIRVEGLPQAQGDNWPLEVYSWGI